MALEQPSLFCLFGNPCLFRVLGSQGLALKKGVVKRLFVLLVVVEEEKKEGWFVQQPSVKQLPPRMGCSGKERERESSP